MPFRCDCPDYTKSIPGDPLSRFEDRRFGRAWEGSKAGADEDAGCKHIYAAKMAAELPLEAPTDVPADFADSKTRFTAGGKRKSKTFTSWSKV